MSNIETKEVNAPELDEEEVQKLTKEEKEKYYRNKTQTTTKPVPDDFVLDWSSIYDLDGQLTLFESNKWYAKSLKTSPKPHWSGNFNKPYQTYRTDLEVKYLLDKINTARKELKTEIGKDPDNKNELEEILEILEGKEIIAFKPKFTTEIEDWGNIDNQFKETPKLVNAWRDCGFTYEQTKKWIDAGLETGQYELAKWIRDKKNISVYQLKTYGDKDELEKEFKQSEPFTETPEEDTDLDKAKKKLHKYLANVVSKYKLTGIVSEDGKGLDEFSREKGHYHHKTANWAKEIENVTDDGNNDKEKDFGDTRDSLLSAFAEFFINSTLNDIEKEDENKKKDIEKYMEEHRDPNELGIYTSKFKNEIETLGLTIPADEKKLEIKAK